MKKKSREEEKEKEENDVGFVLRRQVSAQKEETKGRQNRKEKK